MIKIISCLYFFSSVRLFALTLIGNLFFKELCYDTQSNNRSGCFVAVSAAKKPNLTHIPHSRQHLTAKRLQQFDNTYDLQRILMGKNFRKWTNNRKILAATQRKYQEYGAIYWKNVKLKPKTKQIKYKTNAYYHLILEATHFSLIQMNT